MGSTSLRMIRPLGGSSASPDNDGREWWREGRGAGETRVRMAEGPWRRATYVVDDVSRVRADGDESVLRAHDEAAAVLAPVATRDAPLVLAGARTHLVARATVVQDQRACHHGEWGISEVGYVSGMDLGYRRTCGSYQ